MSEELDIKLPPQPTKITLPLKEFLDYIWNVNSVATPTGSTRAIVRRALGELILMLDPPHPVSLCGNLCHVELVDDKDAEIWQIPQWRSCYERRQAQLKLKAFETAAKERTQEYRSKLGMAIHRSPMTAGMFDLKQADIVALQILLKKDYKKAALFGITIPEDEILML